MRPIDSLRPVVAAVLTLGMSACCPEPESSAFELEDAIDTDALASVLNENDADLERCEAA